MTSQIPLKWEVFAAIAPSPTGLRPVLKIRRESLVGA